MKKLKNFMSMLTLMLVFVFSGCANNKQIESGERSNGSGKFDFEKMENACSDKNEKDACIIEKESKLIEGTCQKNRNNKTLVCRPGDILENMPKSPDMMP